MGESRYVALSRELIQKELAVYGFSPQDDFADRVRLYSELLLRWNERIKLTTVTDRIQIVRFHFGESLFPIRACRIEKGRLADFGSGAGFPGAPLAMALPGLSVRLIESNGRKAAFLAELKRTINLDNAAVHARRAETLGPSEQFDFVTARAIGNYPSLLEWARLRLAPGGVVVLWLGAKDVAQIRGARGWAWQDPLQIPETRERFVLCGSAAG
ncbi:MAG TPA: 16S rRNA (guanine(527)-N(7))-methyltransferase RsmG [Candidatus Cybelea sp.]|nr:16S rRNA (guanine(527)-N(7))-methyltransferase RsmG [Candidatus Cybelea sp.]